MTTDAQELAVANLLVALAIWAISQKGPHAVAELVGKLEKTQVALRTLGFGAGIVV